MAGLDEWTAAACRALGVDAAAGDHQRLVLDLARDVAHGVERPAAPVSTFLLGLAAGQGADVEQAAAMLAELARAWPGEAGDT